MAEFYDTPFAFGHEHVFLGEGHDKNERKTWAVIALCSVMMVVEIVGGSIFGSLALVADGLHMSTHASAMLIAALAYTFARKHARDRRFVFGTGKLGDLAGFTSAIILAMIALLIGYEAVSRFLAPVPIRFAEAIPIAIVGLVVNVASAWLLSGDHQHGHGHHHGNHAHEHEEEAQSVQTEAGLQRLSIYEDGVPPVFRLQPGAGAVQLPANAVSATTVRSDQTRQLFEFADRSGFLESTTEIPEPHAFDVVLTLPDGGHRLTFTEHAHGDHAHSVDSRDHNIRAAYIHVIADAAVSVLAIVGLLMARAFGWLWMDPLAGIVGALVIANWSFGLVRDTGGILLDINPSKAMDSRVRTAFETAGDKLLDLHVWRLGPGHYGAVISVLTSAAQRGPSFYHAMLRQIKGLSHITVEVHQKT
jgi:cation diffusion facilitator family transporter